MNAGDPDRAERRAARDRIIRYHEEQLRLLLEHVREGFARLDAAEIDAFDLDELVHRYKRSARELWKFCGQTQSDMVRVARLLDYWREQGEPLPDWWAAGEPRGRPTIRPPTKQKLPDKRALSKRERRDSNPRPPA